VAKRYFELTFGRYGGEFMMGTVTREFVEYWAHRVEEEGDSDLIQHITAWDDEDKDPDSPPALEDGSTPEPHDIDDFVHLDSAYSDGQYYIREIKLKDGFSMDEDGCIRDPEGEYTYQDGWDEVKDMEYSEFKSYNQLSSREMYSQGTEYSDDNNVPVLMFHWSNKGSFGQVIVETDGEDFDPYLLGLTYIETDIAEFLDRVFYNGKELEINYDWADSTGKGSYARVGFANPNWFDKPLEGDSLQEAIDDFMEEIKFNKEYDQNQ